MAMKNKGTTSLRLPILLAVIVAAVISYFPLYGAIVLLSENRNSDSLVALKQEDVSEIKIFDSALPEKSLLAILNRPNDNGNIDEFVHAINQVRPGELPDRELILSRELYLVIQLNDNDRPLELVFYLHDDCKMNVYIELIKQKGRAKFKLDSAISGADLFEWIQGLDLLSHLGCN